MESQECKVIYVEDIQTKYDIKIYELIKKDTLEDMIEENMNHIPNIW